MRTPSKEPLTPRQLEVAQWTACGLADKEIADKMHVSVSTIANTKRNVNEKYGFNNSCELVAFYFAAYHHVSTEFDKIGKIRKALGAMVLMLLFSTTIASHDDTTYRRTRRCRTEERIEEVRLIRE